jgi:hypothetical protein
LVASEPVLTLGRLPDAVQARYDRRIKPGAHAATQPMTNPYAKLIPALTPDSSPPYRFFRAEPRNGSGRTAASNRAAPHHRCRSDQFGRTSAPTIPHFVQTIRGPNSRTRRSHVEEYLMPAAVAHDVQRPRSGACSPGPWVSEYSTGKQGQLRPTRQADLDCALQHDHPAIAG